MTKKENNAQDWKVGTRSGDPKVTSDAGSGWRRCDGSACLDAAAAARSCFFFSFSPLLAPPPGGRWRPSPRHLEGELLLLRELREFRGEG